MKDSANVADLISQGKCLLVDIQLTQMPTIHMV